MTINNNVSFLVLEKERKRVVFKKLTSSNSYAQPVKTPAQINSINIYSTTTIILLLAQFQGRIKTEWSRRVMLIIKPGYFLQYFLHFTLRLVFSIPHILF